MKLKAEEEEEAERDRLEKLKLEKVIEKAKDYSEEELIKISFDFLDTNNNEEIAVYELTSKKYLNPKGKVEIKSYRIAHFYLRLYLKSQKLL